MSPRDIRKQLIRTTRIYDLSKKDLAKLTGYTYTQIRRWYHDDKMPRMYEMFDWADALGYDIVLVRKKKYAE